MGHLIRMENRSTEQTKIAIVDSDTEAVLVRMVVVSLETGIKLAIQYTEGRISIDPIASNDVIVSCTRDYPEGEPE